jgi:dienelactone hydrolase
MAIVGEDMTMQSAGLEGFTSYKWSNEKISHDVYVIGDGPPVLVTHELSGMNATAVDFARRLAGEGFRVYLPHLFGKPLQAAAYSNSWRLCISREFGRLAAGKSAPITNWLRTLAQDMSTRHSNGRVGAIGMCLTGAFVIPLVIDPWVAAPVAAQPGVPFSTTYLYTGLGGHGSWASQLNVSDEDLAAAGRRLKADNMRLLALRFEEDRICPRARLDRLREAFGDNLEIEELGGASKAKGFRHATLTTEFDKAVAEYAKLGQPLPPDHPVQQVLRRVVEFLRARL